jgi:hypothetical protein
MNRALMVAAILLPALLASHRAKACKVGVPQVHLSDETRRASDNQPPRFTTPPSITVQRGMGSDQGTGCEDRPVTDCSDLGVIRITVPVTDDQTPADQCGFRLALVSGTLPPGFQLPDHDIRAVDGAIILHFPERGGDDPLSFALSVTPVDLAANAGTSVVLPVSTGQGGCSMAPGRPGIWLLVALLAFWAGLRRACAR